VYNTADTDMKTRLSILVAVLGFLMAYYSHTDGIAASNQSESSKLSASKHRPPSNIFDPAGLVSASQQGQLVTLGAGFSFTEGPAVDRHGNVFLPTSPMTGFTDGMPEPVR